MLHVEYESLHEYSSDETGIAVPVVLQAGGKSFPFQAKLDTGATFCIFEREIGEWLGLKIEQGEPQWIGTATGRFKTYGHAVTLSVLNFEFDTTVYFADMPNFGRNVLGRFGFLQLLKCGLVDYENKLYLGRYDLP